MPPEAKVDEEEVGQVSSELDDYLELSDEATAEFEERGGSGGQEPAAEASAEGDDDAKGETDAGAPPASKDPPTELTVASTAQVPIPALLSERDKRQAAEAELEQARAELAKLREVSATPPPDPSEDPKGAYDHLQQSTAVQSQAVFLRTSRMLALDKHKDYAEREQVFMKLANDSPELTQKMLEADNPAEFAYQTAVNHERLQRMQDLDGYEKELKDKLRGELREELLAELKGDGAAAARVDAATSLPSLASTTEAKSGMTVPTDDDLSDIVLGHT